MSKLKIRERSWWGAPKQFTTELMDRKISWLELFYDLVYVIAISKITSRLATHFDAEGLREYIYFFAMIFWGWLNGSLYHDLHGSAGLRTRLMTLWQMIIVAAIVITIGSSPEKILFNATIAMMIMQFYITYLWWSVGIYDKHHRKLNRPYTVIYLTSLGLMFVTLFLKQPYVTILFYITLVLNYFPPFFSHFLLKRESLQLNLSSSMSERLGLFTIIIFGEVVLGIVNGAGLLHDLSAGNWLNFVLAVFIAFSLWWIFFTLISDRNCKKGLVKSSLLELLFIPTLMALGLMSVVFGRIFEMDSLSDSHLVELKKTLCFSLSLFLLGVNVMSYFLEYPANTEKLVNQVRKIIFTLVVLFVIIGFIDLSLSLFSFLLIIQLLLLVAIILLNLSWFRFSRTVRKDK